MNYLWKNPASRNALIAGIICLIVLAGGAYKMYFTYHVEQLHEMQELQQQIDALWPPPDEAILPSKQSAMSNWSSAIAQLSQQHQTYWCEKLTHLSQTLGSKIWLKGATFRTQQDQNLDVDEGWKIPPTTGLLLEGRINSPVTKQQLDEVGIYLLTTLSDPILNIHWQLLNLERVGKNTVAFTVLSQ